MDEENKISTGSKNISNREIEKIVGIEVFSSSEYEGIQAIIKKRYKDFIVKEVIHSGKVLELKENFSPIYFSNDNKDNYTQFNLIKINKDTFEAIRLISKALGIPPNSIGYAGLKDKRSISIQTASIRGNYVEKLKNLKLDDIYIRNIFPSKNPVKLGNNWGNQFVITLRNIKHMPDQMNKIEALFKYLRNYGFPNYFGLQRFGTFRPNSHLIGRFILENQFKKAFEEFVINVYATELPQSQKIRAELAKTGDLNKAFNSFPVSLGYERTMIKYLLDNPGDYEGAINHLPKYLIKLLISSFQSYLFNKMVSLRVHQGNSLYDPVKGDAICILDEENGGITQIKYIYGGLYDEYLQEARKLNRAKIIIPLIGYNTDLDEFPYMKSLFLEIIKNEHISLNIFKNKLLEIYDFKGSFRTIMTKPMGLKLLEYSIDNLYPNKYKMKIEFSLQKGSYATLFLREIIK
ncbi:MAG: tRNA pseudouridine(13) synthase TruD [Candidatus Lokiarchaeota archaeon]|nr:tRNA pseudouridine(13) synthase TruD [Candidatus Lokiarchaeota archaeon]